MSVHAHEPTQSAVKLDGAPKTHEYSVCDCGELIAKFSPNGRWVQSTNQRHPYGEPGRRLAAHECRAGL